MTIIDIMVFAVILLTGVGFFLMALAAFSFAPWAPTRKKDVSRVLKLANIRSGQTFYDLGCGTGTVVLEAARNYNLTVIGVELSFPIYFICKIRSFFGKFKGNLTLKRKNMFKEDLGKADIVYVFGMPNSLEKKLLPKLEAELKPGAKVISYVFEIKGWKPFIVDWPSSKNPIYLYKR